MKTWRVQLALLATALTGCFAREPLSLPDVPERPASPISIYLPVITTPQSGDDRRAAWADANRFASKLERAGFLPAITSQIASIPPATAVITDVRREDDAAESCETGRGFFSLATTLTLGVIPYFGCRLYGETFELRRSIDASPQRIDTRWREYTLAGWFAIPIGLVLGYRAQGALSVEPGERETRALRASILDALER